MPLMSSPIVITIAPIPISMRGMVALEAPVVESLVSSGRGKVVVIA